ncbi:efflux transporter outer membrane subunit [Sphingobacterium paludis]|jgi:outer membrane protein, multidrug efflux system|uniref:NodT family efflux transporter outer membrane factor (OMF) lipoprotein n=1 Tax=Sphingobacterium paludis TaxID=1476465 RepID=A0A4R7DA86_9SPHI|nr:efflux transporter outer membrane subunit [Sphingobacterium paludis]TDS17151.1 NodT family efflux transporter outer membrane factor (OMF) lipoprotein [Sphingobacterium paludis]
MKYLKFVHLVYCIALIAAASACKVGKPYQPPALGLPEEFRGDTITYREDTVIFGHIPWRSFFNDPQLLSLIDSGLANNYDMRTALKNIEIANRNLRQNRLEYLPAFDANIATVNRQYRSRDFYAGPSSKWYTEEGGEAPNKLFNYQSQFASGIEFSWELDIWGRIANQKDQLKAEFLDSYEAKNAIQTMLVSDIAKGYFNLIMLDAQIEVAKRNLTLNDSTLRMIQLQFEAGEITALAIQQTESQRLLAASLIPEIEKEIAIQENSLRVLIGQMPEAVGRNNKIDSLMNTETGITLGAPLEIVRNRPDIKRAEYALISANAQMNIQQIMRYPQLSLNGVFGVNSMLPKNWFNIPGALLGGIVGNLTGPVFRNGRLKNQYEVARLEREKAELELQRSVMEAVSEVSNAVVTVEKQVEQLKLARKRVENSQLAVKNASLLFKGGYATYLEVITAQSNALDSELSLVDIGARQLQAYVDLYRSLGGGWR